MIINKNTTISMNTTTALVCMGGAGSRGVKRVIIAQEVVNYLEEAKRSTAMQITNHINDTLFADDESFGVSLQYMNYILRALRKAEIITRTKTDSGNTITLDNGKTIPLIITLFSINQEKGE